MLNLTQPKKTIVEFNLALHTHYDISLEDIINNSLPSFSVFILVSPKGGFEAYFGDDSRFLPGLDPAVPEDSFFLEGIIILEFCGLNRFVRAI